MRILRFAFILTLITMISIPAMAQDDEGSWRTFEVYVNGGLAIPYGDINDWQVELGADPGFHIGLGGAFYFSESFCTGIYFDYTQLEMDGPYNRNFKNYDLGAYAKYAMVGESSFEPYGKISVGLVVPKYPTWVEDGVLREQSYDPDLTIGAGLGLMYYTSDYSGIFLEASYHYDMIDGVNAVYHGNRLTIDHNASYLRITFGINAFFGPEE